MTADGNRSGDSMLRNMPNRYGCAEFRRLLAMERRSFLKMGALGLAGLSLADLFRAEAAAAAKGKPISRERSVIILWMRGGPSQHETWDPKPEAPIEYRGEFGAMPTKVPGIQICDLLPMSARLMDKWSILRSLYITLTTLAGPILCCPREHRSTNCSPEVS